MVESGLDRFLRFEKLVKTDEVLLWILSGEAGADLGESGWAVWDGWHLQWGLLALGSNQQKRRLYLLFEVYQILNFFGFNSHGILCFCLLFTRSLHIDFLLFNFRGNLTILFFLLIMQAIIFSLVKSEWVGLLQILHVFLFDVLFVDVTAYFHITGSAFRFSSSHKRYLVTCSGFDSQ